MKLIMKIITIISMMCLLACQRFEEKRIITAQSSNSSRAQLDVIIKGDEMMVKLTNLTAHTVEVDGDMEIYFTFFFIEKQKDISWGEYNRKGKPLSKRLVKLAPSESITKVFRKGDYHHSYSTSTYIMEDGRGGRENSIYTYQIPDFTKLSGIVLTYDSRRNQASIPMALAAEEGIETPGDLLDASASLEIKLVKDFENPLPPYIMRGDKDIIWISRD